MNTNSVASDTGIKGHGTANLPGAWYDLSARLEAAHSVACWFDEALPFLEGMSPLQCKQVKRASGLAVAIENMLYLCKQDAEALEQQLMAGAAENASQPPPNV